MRCLVIYCHPVAESYCNAVHQTALTALLDNGHEVRDRDLYAEDFQPVLTRQERLDYHDPALNQRGIEDHIADLQWAEALIFIYPTWWYGLPAMLKGYLDRIWIPDVAFEIAADNSPIRPKLTNIRQLMGITTCGSPWWWMWLVGNPGRRTIQRGLRALCHRRCKQRWLTHHLMDVSTPETRERFLARVDRSCRRLAV